MNEDLITNEEFEKKTNEAIDAGRETVVMFKDTDGNWRGILRRGERFVQVRQIGPETVLQMLITHE